MTAQAQAMNISKEDLKSKKKIGLLDGADVWHLETKGGYHLVAAAKREGTRVLGVGPHRAVAKYMAEKNFPTMRLTELSKSEFGVLSKEELAKGVAEAKPILVKIWELELDAI